LYKMISLMSLLLNKETKKVWAFTVHSTFILSEFTIHNIVYYGNLVLGPSSFDPFYFGDQTLFPINSVLTMFFFSFLLSFFYSFHLACYRVSAMSGYIPRLNDMSIFHEKNCGCRNQNWKTKDQNWY
jgi:hypothetical protein